MYWWLPSSVRASAGDHEGCCVVQAAGPVARLNKTVRRMLLEKLVPTLASLKATLEEARSPLQQPATDCLVHLWREHEAEMEDILVSRRQLSAEIRFKAQVRPL